MNSVKKCCLELSQTPIHDFLEKQNQCWHLIIYCSTMKIGDEFTDRLYVQYNFFNKYEFDAKFYLYICDIRRVQQSLMSTVWAVYLF